MSWRPRDERLPLTDLRNRLTLTDRYSFSGVAGEQVVVQVASAEILPEIALLNPSGSVLTYGYSGTGLVRLPSSGAFTLPDDGVYIIEVAGIGGVDQTGQLHRDPRRDEPAVPGRKERSTTRPSAEGSPNVTMTFTAVTGGGAVPAPVTTAANGQWVQKRLRSGTTYRVTPSLSQYIFSPASRLRRLLADDELLRLFRAVHADHADPHTLR